MYRTHIVVALLCSLLLGCQRASDCVDSPHGLPAPIRIVSLAPSITEAVCAVGAGDLLVGRTSACNYPMEILETVPVIGGFGVPSLELLAKTQPTLVLETDLADEGIGARIDAMGITRRRVRCRGLKDIPEMLREVGALTGHAEQANALASKLSEELSALSAVPVDSAALKVYAEIWHDPMTTIGAGTFLSDLIALAGGVSIGDKASRDYFQISPERVLLSNPDVVLCLYMGKGEGAADAVKARPGWQHLKAVQQNAIYDGLDNDVLLRPGPRVLDGVALLRQCFADVAAGRHRSSN